MKILKSNYLLIEFNENVLKCFDVKSELLMRIRTTDEPLATPESYKE